MPSAPPSRAGARRPAAAPSPCAICSVGRRLGDELGGADERDGAAPVAAVVEHRRGQGVDPDLHRVHRRRPALPAHRRHAGADGVGSVRCARSRPSSGRASTSSSSSAAERQRDQAVGGGVEVEPRAGPDAELDQGACPAASRRRSPRPRPAPRRSPQGPVASRNGPISGRIAPAASKRSRTASPSASTLTPIS